MAVWLEHLRFTLLELLWVGLGSALGGTARFFLSGVVGRLFGETFPWGTMAVNVTGAFAIGVGAGLVAGQASFYVTSAWQFTVTGVLGSYTTVSSFSLQTLALARDGDYMRVAGNVLLSLGLCLSAVALGYAVGDAVIGWRPL